MTAGPTCLDPKNWDELKAQLLRDIHQHQRKIVGRVLEEQRNLLLHEFYNKAMGAVTNDREEIRV